MKSPDQSPAVFRVLVWMILWATIVRVLGCTVGAWARGSLDAGTTLAVGVLAPAWLFVLFPTWVAWRLPRRLRVRPLVIAACWLSPLVRARDLHSIHVFLGIAADQPFPASSRMPADGWTALAAALQAERQQHLARAEQILEALMYLPAGGRLPWLARVHGVESLMMSAIARGDWAAAVRYGQLGRGRLVSLLSLLARGQTGEPVPPGQLWLRWVLAPARLATYRYVRELAARQAAPRSVTPAPTAKAREPGDEPPADARLRHILLMSAALRGPGVSMSEVFALAEAWQMQLDDAALARLNARALELRVRDGAGEGRAIRDAVIEELAQLAASARGALPADPASPLARALKDRARDQLFEQVEAALSPLDPQKMKANLQPLEAWERWLTLRTILERVEEQAGVVALTTLWHGGVRNSVWNWTCVLFNQHQERAAWVAHGMFAWVADRAESLGDLSTTLINRENARIALRAA